MMNKKGDASFITVLLVVVALALIVFVILAYVFGINVFDVVKRVMPNKANVDDIVRNCRLSGQTNSQNSYCCTLYDVRRKDGDKLKSETCQTVLGNEYDARICVGYQCSNRCIGQATTCAKVIEGIPVAQQEAKCKAQIVLKTTTIAGQSPVFADDKCVYDPAGRTCAEPAASGDDSYAVKQCNVLEGLDAGNDAAKKKICETQAGCSWI